MNFISNVLDAVPVVGHAKALIHYAAGDAEGGHRAVYQSTRTSAVMAGGFVGGVVGGPAGAVCGAMYSGTVTDAVASGTMGKSQGIVRQCGNVYNDFKHGRNPTGSLVTTGAHLALDAVGGLGMGSISTRAAANSLSKNIASNAGEKIFIEKTVKITAEEVAKFSARKGTETIVKKTLEKTAETVVVETILVTTHIAERGLLETVEEERAMKNAEQKKGETKATEKDNGNNTDKNKKSEKETGKKTSGQSGKNTETGSGSQPPDEKKDNNKKDDGGNNPNNFSDFLKLLKEILEIICPEEDREKFYKVFENLSKKQKYYVVTLIKKLNYYSATEKVLKLVIQLFNGHFSSKLKFVNFLSLMEFVATYVVNKIRDMRIRPLETGETALSVHFKKLDSYLLTVVTGEFSILKEISDTFNKIRFDIELYETENANELVDPNFRDTFSKVYHYFKHKTVPGDGILSVSQYYYWIRKLLEKVKRLPEWSELCNPPNERKKIVYELYVAAFGRRITIIVKRQGDAKCYKIVLATCFIVSMTFVDDTEGDDFIDGVRKRKI